MPSVMAAAWRMFREGGALHQVSGRCRGASGRARASGPAPGTARAAARLTPWPVLCII
jgi:hypothetical protein